MVLGMETETRADRTERSELLLTIVMGLLTVGWVIYMGWMRIWPDVRDDVVRVRLGSLNDAPRLVNESGEVIGRGGEQTVRIGLDLLPAEAVAFLRASEIGEVVIGCLIAISVALLARRVLRRGLFDRKLSRTPRLVFTGFLMLWMTADFLRGHGDRLAVEALDLPEGVWAGYSGATVIIVFVIGLLVLAWFEVILKAGRRIARDQDGVI